MVYTDTIAAIATALSSSGIGIIRISGSDAVAVAERMFEPAVAGKRLSEQKTYTIHYGYIRDGEERIDEVLLLLMRGPHSYTAGLFFIRPLFSGVFFYISHILSADILSGRS